MTRSWKDACQVAVERLDDREKQLAAERALCDGYRKHLDTHRGNHWCEGCVALHMADDALRTTERANTDKGVNGDG